MGFSPPSSGSPPASRFLKTTGGVVRIDAGAAPAIGDVLVATSPTAAAWTAPGGAGGPATAIDTTGAAVDVSAAAPPSAGQVLTATDATHATWQTPAGGGAHAASHEPGGGDALAVDAAAATGSLRTLGTGAAQAAAGNDARLSDDRTAGGLRSATTVVAVSGATAPSSGQVLTATSSTAATWQTPSGGAGADMTVLDWLGW